MTDPKDMTNAELTNIVLDDRNASADDWDDAALEIAARLKAMDWQPIESAPKDGAMIIAYAPDPFLPVHGYRGVAQWSDNTDLPGTVVGWFWNYAKRPEFWQPFPAPPKETT